MACRACNFLGIVCFILAGLVPYNLRDARIQGPGPVEILTRLDVLGINSAVTYRATSANTAAYVSLLSSIPADADTTAVLLNWTRLSNVILIVTMLCGPQLNGIIEEIFIWNNNPNTTLSPETFNITGCPPRKLRIHNSPENAYFKARFTACADSRTPYCFIQDDDYIINSKIIQNMHAFLVQMPASRAVHLLPPHEHLSSRLRTIYNPSSKLSASFAWLGYGTYVPRSMTLDFLDTLRALDMPESDMQMADNYFTILSNRVPEIWLDHGVELGGGQPFTVGVEGDMRNMKHIVKALDYLDNMLSNKFLSSLPSPSTSLPLTTRAPCRLTTCLIETNINLLPGILQNTAAAARDMISVEEANRKILGQMRTRWYTEYPLSLAVDGKPETAFRSLENALKGESITLDMLGALAHPWEAVELAWLVNAETVRILHRCQFSKSVDGHSWVSIPNQLDCFETRLEHHILLGSDDTSGAFDGYLTECSILVEKPTALDTMRFFRTMLVEDISGGEKWSIHEHWLRGVSLHE